VDSIEADMRELRKEAASSEQACVT